MIEEKVELEVKDLKAPVLGDIHYPVTVVDIDALIDKFKNIKNIDLEDENVKEHYALIRDGQRQFQKARTAIETARKEFKAPAIAYGKKVDEVAKSLQEKIAPYEQFFVEQRKIYDDHEAKLKKEAEEAERKRIEKINNKIDFIRNLPLTLIDKSSDDIRTSLSDLRAEDINDETYEEFTDIAKQVHEVTCLTLQNMVDSKAEIERIENQRKEELRIQQEEKEKLRKEAEEARKAQEEAERKLKEQADAIRAKEEAEAKAKDDKEIRVKREEEEARIEREKKEQEQKERDEAEARKAQEEARIKAEYEAKSESIKEARRESIEGIATISGLSKVKARMIVEAIEQGEVPHIKFEL